MRMTRLLTTCGLWQTFNLVFSQNNQIWCVPNLMLKTNPDNFDKMSAWEERWNTGSTPWHLSYVNNLLKKGYSDLISSQSIEGKTIFVPLCGKTFDLKWLYDQGLNVVGVEFARKPIIEFFNEHGLVFNVENFEDYDICISSDGRMKIFRSDLFLLNESHYGGRFDYIWDRGSLCAMAKENQEKYVQLISSLMKQSFSGHQEVYEYEESLRNRTPYPFFKEDLERLYGEKVTFEELARLTIEEADHTINANENTVLYKFWRK